MDSMLENTSSLSDNSLLTSFDINQLDVPCNYHVESLPDKITLEPFITTNSYDKEANKIWKRDNLSSSYSELFSDYYQSNSNTQNVVPNERDEHIDSVFSSNLNSSKVGNYLNGSRNQMLYGSVEVLNTSTVNTVDTLLSHTFMIPPDNKDAPCYLIKSFSSSYLPYMGEEDHFDFDLKWKNSTPSEDELDEMGLPVSNYPKHYLSPPGEDNVKDSSIVDIISKFKRFKASIGGFNENDQEREEDVGHSNTFTIDDKDEATQIDIPIQREVQEVHFKKNNAGVSKGPMKAFAPLQSMTKQMGIKIMSPFKKKKATSKPQVRSVSPSPSKYFNDGQPIAASTPTGDRSSRKDDSIHNNSTFVRSLSEGRMTPVKNKAGTILNVSYTKAGPSSLQPSDSQNQNQNLKTKLQKNTLISQIQPLKKQNHAFSQIKPKIRSSLGLRPSSAPIKPSLTGKFISSNSSVFTTRTSLAKPIPTARSSILKPVNTSSVPLKQSLMDKKLRRPSSVLDKENKRDGFPKSPLLRKTYSRNYNPSTTSTLMKKNTK